MSNLLDVKKTVALMQSEFAKVLPEHVTPEKFVRTINTALMNNPSLADKDKRSLMNACMQCAADGLLPDGNEAALVPFGGSVKYTPMIAGILKKVRNSGELSSVASAVVYEKDVFEYYTDETGEKFMHKPLIVGDRGGRIGVYAQAVTKSGGRYFEFMNVDQIKDVKGMVKQKNGPWHGPFEDEMWRKTVLRKLSKRLPMSTDQEQVLKRDDSMYDFALAKPRDVSPQIQVEGPVNLKHILAPDIREVEATEEI